MSTRKDTVDLSEPGYADLNVGGVLEANLDRIRDLGVNCVLVQIHSPHLHGQFMVPLAIGFSTPVSLLSGAVLLLDHSEEKPPGDVLEAFIAWRKTHRTKPLRSPTYLRGLLPRPFTEDQLGCFLCVEDYKMGDQVFDLECKHRFHWSCIGTWIMKDCRFCNKLNPKGDLSDHYRHFAFFPPDDKSGKDCPRCRGPSGP